MSSIIERLTEGVVSRDMRSESHALLSKWEKTGLLEGLHTDRSKNTMARLLENQAKELLRESSSMSAGDVEGFASVAFPIVRRVFAGLIANDLVSVQPMSLPSGLIFFLDFVYSPDLGGTADALSSRFGNVTGSSIYGTDRVGSQITGGVNLVDSTYKTDLSGPRNSARGYSYASPTGSNDGAIAADGTMLGVKAAFLCNGSVSETNAKLIQYDPDLLASTDSSIGIVVIDILSSEIATGGGVDDIDFDNMSAFQISDTALATLDARIDALTGDAGGAETFVRRLTQHITDASESAASADSVRFVLSCDGSQVTAADTSVTSGTAIGAGELTFPVTDNINAGGAVGSVVGAAEWGLEGSANIPEIDIKVDSIAVTAQTKKLKAKWTPELGQDLNAYHNLDAEVELTSILSEQIALEIDREILADLVSGAKAATYYWSRSPGLFVNRETGAELGATAAAPDFTGTVSEWYETLVETINDVSAQIHRKTLRGGANFLVCSPEVANILEFTAGFRASVTHDSETGSVGAVNVGSLSKKFDVIVDPYFLRQVVLVGRRGSSFLESGYVYAPYVPLQTTPTIFGVEDFVPRKGVMTRYAKKMVRPDMYGLVICRGILGESGSS
tara:strand:- start:23637 stop:25490 length:1854 start_codon:yes stop_codon:yes gene_type:complete